MLNRLPELKDELLVVLDVDGVTRHGVTDTADESVIAHIKALFAKCGEAGVNLQVAFISGSPSFLPDPNIPEYIRGSEPLSHVFGNHFLSEMRTGRVEIYGQLGGDILLAVPHSSDSTAAEEVMGKLVRGYSHSAQAAILRTLIEFYHRDLELTDAEAFQLIAPIAERCIEEVEEIAKERDRMAQHHNGPPFPLRVPEELEEYVLAVRKTFDPKFRLVSNGATVEYHDFKSVMKTPHSDLIVPGGHGFCSSGLAHREADEFRFVLVSHTNKGNTVGKLVDDRRKEIARRRGGDPAAHELEVITIGDTAIDYPMHAMASTPFHVGLPAVWDAHDSAEVAHVALVTGKDGTAPQVEGTVSVLAALLEGLVTGPEGSKRGLDMTVVQQCMSSRLMLRETLVD
jgi:hypothetical protein